MDICDELEAKWGTVHNSGAFNAMLNAKREIERLRTEVARLKEHAVVLADTERHVERERCAKLCEAQKRDGEYQYNAACGDCADEIRVEAQLGKGDSKW